MSSYNKNNNWILQVYKSPRMVFGLADIAILTHETDSLSLTKKLHYQVGKGNLLNPRKGIYAKPNFDIIALACTLYTPSYVSLDYVCFKKRELFFSSIVL